MGPKLSGYHWIVVSSSAGKDSQAMLDYVVEQCDQCRVPRSRLVVAHADLGRVEWPGTRELAEEQARHYGLAFSAISRPQGDLLHHIEQRGMSPSPSARYCTANHKRAPVSALLTRLAQTSRCEGASLVRILNCMGMRAEESPARAKKSHSPSMSGTPTADGGTPTADAW